MAELSSLHSIDTIVLSLLGKEGKDDDDFFRYKKIALDGVQEFHMLHFENVVDEVVTVNSTYNTFSYPDGYVRYVGVATPIDGRWWYFTKDDSFAPLNDGYTGDALSEPVQSSLPNIAEYKFPSDLSDGGGYNKYYFKEDVQNRRFQIGGFNPDVVVLRYVHNGLNTAGVYSLPVHARDALESYIRWKIADFDDHAESTVLRLERQYKEAVRKMRNIQRPAMQDIIDALNASKSQLLRR